jgi:phosphoglycerate dehydrogenase-like enzyme
VAVEVAFPAYRRRYLPGQIDARARLLVFDSSELEAVDLSGAEVLVVGGPAEIDVFARLLELMPRLAWVHSFSTGLERLVEHWRDGVLLTNAAGAYASPLAEFAVWGMMALRRRFDRALALQRERRWDSAILEGGLELRGCRVGVVGYGAIGRYTASAFKGLGVEVWAMGRTPVRSLDLEPIDRWLPADRLHELLAGCDGVVLAASLNSSTRRLIDEEALRAMSGDAILINLGRGALVDEDALVRALAEGRLGGAVLDVTTIEPLPEDHPLWSLPNVIISPHTAGATDQAYDRVGEIFRRNLTLYLDGHGERMINLVNRETIA